LLKERDIPFEYREYRTHPLTENEIRRVLALLGAGPRELLRPRDRAAKQLGLSGDEGDERLIQLMAEHPTLLQRPIGILGDRAVVGRPPENLLTLVE